MRTYPLFARFVLLSFILFLLVGFSVFLISNIQIVFEGFIAKQEKLSTVIAVNRAANHLLKKEDFHYPMEPDGYIRMNRFFADTYFEGAALILITDNKGTVIYSHPKYLALLYNGTSLMNGQFVPTTLKDNETHAQFVELEPKGQETLGFKMALVQSVPITFGNSVAAVGAVYIISRAGFITKSIQGLERDIVQDMVMGLLALYVVLTAIVLWLLKIYQRQTDEIIRLKDEFVFIAAHDMRMPASTIKAYVSLLFDEPIVQKTTSIKESVDYINIANEQHIELINDLLEVARSESGRIEIHARPMDVIGAIQSILVEMNPLADKKSISITYDHVEPLPRVMADESRVKEVVTNLVGNAIKYTPGPGMITVTHEVKKERLITHVRDTGIGIPFKDQKNLFEKFYRVRTDKTIDVSGTGLGLFIAKQIVEKMNGKVWVKSEEGKGSTFSFSLPLAQKTMGRSVA
ncbi:MAG: hypothetical protein A2939_01435 [Parcubacteria group bacterium RIFCSPLOWO2_01_FULL_48_18]|nr:MAG: hypothetical protein A2939_01435 [Parcubacteria group bacterium RIFCSPLOWO2_01_FULL_48_18]OHB22131.1 MAG: hypothetical protein A3J67_04395 [Parcubacteria group bacterium RIFCSPHIGHO2_02_FULL_48_10b]